MPVTMDAWKVKRKEWTTARDAAHVKKGAVTSVSIGDRLDKVYAASAKGYKPLLAATASLRKDLGTYQTKGGKSVLGAKGYLDTLGKDVQKLETAANADLSVLTKLIGKVVEFHQLVVPGSPDPGQLEKTRAVIAQDATGATTWLDAAAKTDLYKLMPVVTKRYEDFIKDMRAVTFQVTLPGKAGAYNEIKDAHEAYLASYKALRQLAKSTTVGEHSDRDKVVGALATDLTAGVTRMRAAVASLLG